MPIAPLKPDANVFVHFSDADAPRILHAGRVLETDPEAGISIRLTPGAARGDRNAQDLPETEHAHPDLLGSGGESVTGSPASCTAAIAGDAKPEIEGPLARVEHGQSALLFFEWNQRFSQQPSRVSAVSAEISGLRVTLQATGRLSCAESRECFRVSALSADLWACIGENLRCEILDVSATGFSAFVPEELPEGTLLELTVTHAGQHFPGQVRVRGTRRTPSGRLRCGFHCIEDPLANQLLLSALPRINLALQREQLARRSGLRSGPPPSPGLIQNPRFVQSSRAARSGSRRR